MPSFFCVWSRFAEFRPYGVPDLPALRRRLVDWRHRQSSPDFPLGMPRSLSFPTPTSKTDGSALICAMRARSISRQILPIFLPLMVAPGRRFKPQPFCGGKFPRLPAFHRGRIVGGSVRVGQFINVVAHVERFRQGRYAVPG